MLQYFFAKIDEILNYSKANQSGLQDLQKKFFIKSKKNDYLCSNLIIIFN